MNESGIVGLWKIDTLFWAVVAILLIFGDASTSLDDFYCNVEQYNACCKASATVDRSTVNVHYSNGNMKRGTEVQITWHPVESTSPIQYEVLLIETSAGGSCYDPTMMPNPCEPFEGGILVDDSSYRADNIVLDSNFICRIRVVSNGVPAGLSICVDRRDIDLKYSIAVPECAREYFECSDGTCIPQYAVCDDERNCADGGDEKVCTREMGSVRLANGNETAGRVEIHLGGQWGTVCDNNWNMEEAEVVCRELGFSAAISAIGGAHFGEGEGLIQMDNVVCSGREAHLVMCPFTYADCTHSEDASVVCEDGAEDAAEDPGFFVVWLRRVGIVCTALGSLGAFIAAVVKIYTCCR